MNEDVIINKVAAIERCLARVREEYQGDPNRLETLTVQDSIVLNLQRACEAAIDLAMHVVATGRLGIPQDSRSAFELLHTNGIIGKELADQLKAMVGFRNIAVHEYQKLHLPIVVSIVENKLGEFEEFIRAVLKAGTNSGPDSGNPE